METLIENRSHNKWKRKSKKQNAKRRGRVTNSRFPSIISPHRVPPATMHRQKVNKESSVKAKIRIQPVSAM